MKKIIMLCLLFLAGSVAAMSHERLITHEEKIRQKIGITRFTIHNTSYECSWLDGRHFLSLMKHDHSQCITCIEMEASGKRREVTGKMTINQTLDEIRQFFGK